MSNENVTRSYIARKVYTMLGGLIPDDLNFSLLKDPNFLYPAIAITGVTLFARWRTQFWDDSGWVVKKKLPKNMIRHYLERDMTYFRYMPLQYQDEFIRRVDRVMRRKRFIWRARDGRQVDDRMRTLVAGSAVQLTFGLEELTLAHFRLILLYPNAYYSRITRKYHHGEVNAGGAIVLAWPHFVQGYLDHSDGRNLGIHEMAHALRLENRIHNEEFDFIPKKAIEEFDRQARAEIEISRTIGGSFFRNYGMTNMHEFFSVACENFFERPHGFKAYNPDLYGALSELLRQDPTKWLPQDLEKRNPSPGEGEGFDA